MFVSLRTEAAYTYSPETYTLSGGSAGVVFAPNGGPTATASFTSGGATTTVTFSVPALNPPKGPGTTTLNLGDVSVVTNAPSTATHSFSFNFSDSIPIANTPPPGTSAGTGTLLYTGTINVIAVGTGTGQVTATNLVATGSTNINGAVFSISNPTFGNPTINAPVGGGAGNISADISVPVGVPAPASIVMLGLGMGAMGLVRVGRRYLAA